MYMTIITHFICSTGPHYYLCAPSFQQIWLMGLLIAMHVAMGQGSYKIVSSNYHYYKHAWFIQSGKVTPHWQIKTELWKSKKKNDFRD